MPRDFAQPLVVAAEADLSDTAQRLRNSRLKRVIDVAIALGGIIFLSPFLVLVALLIRIESPGPAVFRQWRTGYDGVPFLIYKFRTMCVCEDGPSVVQAMRGDCRTTRWGNILRHTSVDELPQLLNVLRGEMSLVGPRPHAIVHDRYYAARIATYNDRFLAKPGISGLAQVSGLRGEIADVSEMKARVERDLEYIRTWSIRLDLWILVRTLLLGPFDPAAY